MMGSDTTYYSILSFNLNEVKELPKKGLKIDYMNGKFQINRGAGHVHFFWVKKWFTVQDWWYRLCGTKHYQRDYR